MVDSDKNPRLFQKNSIRDPWQIPLSIQKKIPWSIHENSITHPNNIHGRSSVHVHKETIMKSYMVIPKKIK